MNKPFALSILSLLFLPYTLTAQIPNPGFENWTGTEPDGWTTTNVVDLSVFPITKVADAHSGNFALKGTIVTIPQIGFAQSAVIQAGPGGNGFAVSVRYAALTGFYKCSLLGGDMLGLTCGMLQGGSVLAVNAARFTANASTWTAFTVPLTYSGAGNPDICTIQATIFGPTTGADYHVGSWYELDDLALTGPTGIRPEARPAAYSLEQNFPNPFNPSTTIRYTLADRSFVTLTVYTMLGEKVAGLVDGWQGAGPHEVRFDAGRLASGVYFYSLRAEGFVQMREMQLIK